MSMFTQPLSQLNADDLQELLQERAVENARLEFKREVPDKDETLKKLSSFANTFGGFMVVGASARSNDGRIEGLPGVDEQAGYKQKVVDWCFSGASPPLTVEVSDPIPVPAGSGKICYVIHTPESDVAPHFLNSRKGVWVRTDEYTDRFEAQLANDNELRHLLDRRKLIQERRTNLLSRARRRFETYTARMHTDYSGNRTKFGPRLELCVVPRFPARPLCEQGNLRPLITNNSLNWRQTQFPKHLSNVISQQESAIILEAAGGLSIFEANVWGMLFYGKEIEHQVNEEVGIHLHDFLGCVLLFIHHADKMLQVLGYSGPILIETALSSILGAQWFHSLEGSWISNRPPGPELDDNFAFTIETTSAALHERPDGIAMELLRYIFFSVNWPDLIDTPQKLNDLVLRAYDYNFWPRSPGLRI
jgi:Putative DNA-binding domain